MADTVQTWLIILFLAYLIIQAITKKSDSVLLNMVQEFNGTLRFVIEEIRHPKSLRRIVNAILAISLFSFVIVCLINSLRSTGRNTLLHALLALLAIVGFFFVGHASKSVTFTDGIESPNVPSRWFRS